MDDNSEVIIVESSQDDFIKVSELLKAIGYQNIFLVGTTETAIRQLAASLKKRQVPAAIFVELEILKKDDLALLKYFKAYPALRAIPFVGLTHEYEREIVIKSVHAGIDDIILKSFTAEQIAERLSRIKEERIFSSK